MNTLSFLLFSEEESLFITLGKICVAFILGGIIGLERESKGKPVGFKTCVIISVASCVLTIVSIQSAEYGEPAEFGKNRTLRFSGHP